MRLDKQSYDIYHKKVAKKLAISYEISILFFYFQIKVLIK